MALPNFEREGKWNLPTHLEVDNNQILVNSRNVYHKILISVSASFLIGGSYVSVGQVIFILKELF